MNNLNQVDSTDNRYFDPARLIDPPKLAEVFREFRQVAPDIFGENLAFGFVFGGFAKGYAVENQDADFFICLLRDNQSQLEIFREWYFDLHKRYGFWPDVIAPGSVSSLNHLREKIQFAVNHNLRPIIESYYEYQAIVWADIMSGSKAAKIGDLKILDSLEQVCELLPQRWRRELLEILGPQTDPEVAKLPITRLFRRCVTYEKKGDRFTPPTL